MDLSKIQLESVIVWVVKQKFPPSRQRHQNSKTMKSLLILALLLAAALPANATSIKDWEKKSDADKVYFLGACVVNLTADVADPIRPWR